MATFTVEATRQIDASLALLGGGKAVRTEAPELFHWPIITEEDEAAVLDVLRRGAMSGTDVTRRFEDEFAAWQGSAFGLGFSSGTAGLHSAMFACGIGVGDEIICPSFTYWASALPCFSLGASVVFADIDPATLCLDPADIEARISERTRAIVVVHYAGYPAEMDEIMAVARRHGLKVIEDVSHAQGGLYKGRRLGSIGDVGVMSLMSAKAFAIGEGGILVTDDHEIFERAVAFGHYERYRNMATPDLRPFEGLPLGGCKYRMHQLSAAVGRVQLKYYDERSARIRKAMNYFWDCLEGVPGISAHRVDESTGSNMGGWYCPTGHYRSEELGGLPMVRFAEAVEAEGSTCGTHRPALHLHAVFNDCDIYGHGRPTRTANSTRDLRQSPESLPVSMDIVNRIFSVPWFKQWQPSVIEEHAEAYRKVAENCELYGV